MIGFCSSHLNFAQFKRKKERAPEGALFSFGNTASVIS